jgi:hypothetical protein
VTGGADGQRHRPKLLARCVPRRSGTAPVDARPAIVEQWLGRWEANGMGAFLVVLSDAVVWRYA